MSFDLTDSPKRRRFGLRERPVSHLPGRPFKITVGLAGVAAFLTMAWIGFNAPNSIPLRSYYTVHALFANADNLTPHDQIRVAGRLVGQVLNPRVYHGLAEIDMQLDPSVKPLLSDTTVLVRPRSPIGVRFVQVIPGTRGVPLANGATIQAAQTSSATGLDTVLGTLDTTRRAEAQTLFNQLGIGFLGRGAGLRNTISNAPSFLSDTQSVAAAVNARGGAPARFIRGSQGAAAAADPVRDTIATGWEPEAAALQPYSAHASALSSALDAAPGALTSVRGGLAQTDPLLTQVEGFAAAVRPTFQTAPASLTRAAELLRGALPGLRAAAGTLGLAGRATSPVLGLLSRIQPVLPAIDTALAASLPLVEAMAPRECDYGMFARNWGSMLGFGIPGGPLGTLDTVRLNVQGDDESLNYAAKPSLPAISQPYPGPCQARSAP
jgi:ABC-type transporter Mla subunit MlaD